MRKSVAIFPKAGATIDDVTVERKVKLETVNVAAHFFRADQFFGLSGSLTPLQVT